MADNTSEKSETTKGNRRNQILNLKQQKEIQDIKIKNFIDDTISFPTYKLELDSKCTNERYDSFGDLSPRIVFGVKNK